MNILQRISFVSAALLLGAFVVTSCDDSDSLVTTVNGSAENTVYFNMGQPLGQVNFAMNSPVVSTSAVMSGAHQPIKFLVQCTRPAAEDIHVQLAKDVGAIPEGWNDFPGSVNVLNKMEFTIPKGETKSKDTVKISISSAELVALKQGKFMLPFKISSVSGGAMVSSNMAEGTYGLDVSFTNISTATPPGTVMNPKPTGENAWTVVATKANGAAMTITNEGYMFDDATGTTQYASTGDVSPGGTLPFTMDIDLKQVYAGINGFRILSSANNYRLTGLRVYTRKSASDVWESQGPIAFETNNNHYVNFLAPVDARFVRCEVTSVQNAANGLRMVDFNIYRSSW